MMKINFKNTRVFALAILIAVMSCSKEQLENENAYLTLDIEKYHPIMNKEAFRIYNIFADEEDRLSIVDNANYGISANEETDHLANIMGGKTNSDLILSLDGDVYSPNSDGGHWTYFKEPFRKYYGKTVAIKLEDSEVSQEYSVYIPKEIKATKQGTGNSLFRDRVGNILNWNADELNQSGLILLNYTTYADFEENEIIKNEVIPVVDNGTYSLDPFISSEVKAIHIMLTRGNAIEFKAKDGKKINFNIRSSDMHSYYFE